LPVLTGATVPKFQAKLKVDFFSKPVASIIIGISLAFILFQYSWQVPEWEHSLGSLSPLPKTYNQRDNQLRATLGVSDFGFVVLITGNTIEEVLQKSELIRPKLDILEKNGRIAGYEMSAQYLPSQSLQNQRKQYLPDHLELSQTMSQVLHDFPFKSALFQPFLEDVESSKKLNALSLTDLKGLIFEPIVSSLLLKISGKYYGLINIKGLASINEIEAGLRVIDSNGSSLEVLIYDLKTISADLMDQFYTDFMSRIFIAILLIILILFLTLKDFIRTLVVISVLFLSLSIEVALLSLFGHLFTLFHLVSLILVFGLGLDYALFFTRKESNAEKQKTVYGLLICLASSILVFGILSFSGIPVLHIIGLTTAIGVSLAFFFSMLTSALLAKNT
jgi:predicted exporter